MNVIEEILFSITATELFEKKIAEIQNGHVEKDAVAGFLRHMIAHTKLDMDEVYVNTTELLLSGVDTVSVVVFCHKLFMNNINPVCHGTSPTHNTPCSIVLGGPVSWPLWQKRFNLTQFR